MRAASAPERTVVFRAAATYVSADLTLKGYGEFSIPIGLAGMHHATIATSCALLVGAEVDGPGAMVQGQSGVNKAGMRGDTRDRLVIRRPQGSLRFTFSPQP